jgi:hypothetical protein
MSTTAQQPAPDNIDAKKKEQTGEGEENSWGSFFISCLKMFVLLLVITFLGANFIYLSSHDDLIENSEFLFPTDESSYFPPPGFPDSHPAAQKGGYFAAEKCQGVSRITPKYMLIGYEFPYNVVAPKESIWDLMQSFKNWFARTCADTYKVNRGLARDFYSFFAPNAQGNIFANETFLLFIMGPLTLLLSFLVPIFAGLGVLFYGLQANFWWWLFGLLFMWTFVLAAGIALAQFLQFLKTVLFMPLLMDSHVVKTILHCNVRSITVVYGWFVCGAAFDSLDPTIAIVMAIVYCIFLIKMFWSDAKALVGLA